MAAEKPILWLSDKNVIVLTSNGPKKEVNLPDVANKPKPFAWSFFFNSEVIITRLADWIGPIKNPLIAAIKRNNDLE